ncbi:MAG: hypothetical protein QNJ45_14075 [Ardenticatenaceae bacterium]|nr:hypothetical protein [Ardenticatenaceae bacterium]
MDFTDSGGRNSVSQPKSQWQKVTWFVFWHLLPLALFLLLDRWLQNLALLPEVSFFQPVIFLETFQFNVWQFILLAVFTGGLAIYRWGFGSWGALHDGKIFRFLIGGVALILAWWFATLDVNLYFGQAHIIDRLLLIALALLVMWRPVFVLPFLLVLLPFNAQFHYPLGNHSIAQISLPSHLLMIFFAGYVVQRFTGRQMGREIMFLICCLIASSYVWPGIGKIQLGWVAHRHVYLMIFSSYSVGWLGFLEPEIIADFARFMAFFDWPVVVITLVIEVGAIILLWRRKTALFWFASFVALNTSILITSGIFFWTWIIINATMVVLLWRFGDRPLFQIFSTKQFYLSLPIILAGSFLFRPAKLAWLDAPINYSYQLEATTIDGQTFPLSTRFLAPYDTHFALGNLGLLDNGVQLGIVWGAVHDFDIAQELALASNEAEIWQIEQAYGVNAFDEDEAARFDRFVARIAGQLNDQAAKQTALSWIKAPRQVWTFHEGDEAAYTNDQLIESVIVYQVVSFYDGQSYRIIRQEPVREITGLSDQ